MERSNDKRKIARLHGSHVYSRSTRHLTDSLHRRVECIIADGTKDARIMQLMNTVEDRPK